MRIPVCEKELRERIDLNFHRLADSAYYQIGEVFSAADYDWPGDKEGRALLAFVSHYKISGKEIPCMRQMMQKMPSMLNEKGYLGTARTDVIVEQQLSGHSWLLRGLCEYYTQFGDPAALDMLERITENLFLRTAGRYGTYPIDRSEIDAGGVSGSEIGSRDAWLLSSDVGCAFMSIDGLSHVYLVTRDERVKALLDEMIGVFLSIDKAALRTQTHCTLTAARGMMRLYGLTGDEKYLKGASDIYELYVYGGGMTYTYQNLNWWRRPDTWTEPCAVIDSMMLALELFKSTGRGEFRTTAARVWHNGFATLQRDNGGAGTDTVVTADSPWDYLQAQMYEAFFCCTMRLSEGLWYANENRDLLFAETVGEVVKNENGVYADGDILYAQPDEALLPYAEKTVKADGLCLTPIVKYYRVPKQVFETARQKILFR